MCDPATVIMVGSKLAQTAFEKKAAGEVDEQRAAAIRSNYNDLDTFRDNAARSYQKSLQTVAKPAADISMQEKVAGREAAYAPKFGQTDLLPGQGDASGAVKMGVVNALGRGAANAAGHAKRRAAVDAYGDVDLDQNIALGRNASDIDQQGNFAYGRSRVLPYELNAADHAGDNYAGMADAANALGTIGSAAYGLGAGEGWWGGFDPKTGITWNSGRKGAV